MRLTEDGQTCESQGLQPIENEAECKQAIEYATGDSVENVDVVNCAFCPKGCYTGCYQPTLNQYYCETFNSAQNNFGVNSDNEHFVYCRALSIPSTSPITSTPTSSLPTTIPSAPPVKPTPCSNFAEAACQTEHDCGWTSDFCNYCPEFDASHSCFEHGCVWRESCTGHCIIKENQFNIAITFHSIEAANLQECIQKCITAEE